jgi:site-specific recombinase XerD
MSHTEFSLDRFENRNGVISWRVSGLLAGVRIRKNLKTREEAAVEKASLEIKAIQLASGIRLATTFLTDDQLREAESLFHRVAGTARPLSALVDYALAHHREADKPRPLAECVAAYLATKKREQERDLISPRQYDSIKRDLERFAKQSPKTSLGDFTPAVLTQHLERGRPAPSLNTFNNRRGVFSTFFKYALQQDWITTNPILKIPHHRIAHRRGSAVTITAEQAESLMHYAENYAAGVMVPYFALCLFAGIRPSIRDGEISKLDVGSINLATGVIHIEPEVSKVRMKRHVTIHPNLVRWLQAYPLDKFPLIPKNAKNYRRKILRHFSISSDDAHDILRHTFISMHVAKYRSMGEAALQAGNSESIIRKHYLDLKTPAEAEQFFGIIPKHTHVDSVGAKPIPFEQPAAALKTTG